MQYYIEISSWNLIESFVTESISPYTFYGERNFGNNLSRYLSGEKEKYNCLILSTKDLGGDLSLVVDESLIDTAILQPIKDLKTAFLYPKTIYYRRGLVNFRFGTEQLKESVIAESQILLEVKCLEKYKSDFYVKEKKNIERKGISNFVAPLSFEKKMYINWDNKFNKVKGAIIGYTRGIYTSSDETNLNLLNKLRDLKNAFGGMNTQIMMSDRGQEAYNLPILIGRCKNLYEATLGKTNSFDVLVAQFNEIVKLVEMRSKDLKENGWDHKDGLLEEKTKIENAISDIEKTYNIIDIKEELNKIKVQEKKNGEKSGKKRLYFKKGSPEYERKKELTIIIAEFEKKNTEYQLLKRRLKIITQELNTDVNKYDAILSAIFTRISDILNDLIKNASSITSKSAVDLSQIEIKNGIVNLQDKEDSPEISYFNILLSYILEHTNSMKLSEYSVLHVLEESAKIFKESPISICEKGMTILNTLREYWLYKNQRTESFTIPDGMPIFQSIMSFFVKPLGFDQIERFMMIKKYSHKAYAFMLWGAWIGFADIPKIFTNVIYQNNDIDSLIERKLYTMITQVDFL